MYTEKAVPDLSPAAQGQVGIVNAKRIWQLNQQFWADKRLPLKQEMIFASTGTKKPEDPPWKYVEAFAGSDIETNPPATNDAVQKSGRTFTRQVDQMPPKAVLDEIDAKVDMQKLEETLMEEGLAQVRRPAEGAAQADRDQASGVGAKVNLTQGAKTAKEELLGDLLCGLRLREMYFFTTASQRRPFVVQPFLFDLPHLAFGEAEALGDHAARAGHAHFLVLRFHQGQEDFLAPRLGRRLFQTVRGHGRFLSTIRRRAHSRRTHRAIVPRCREASLEIREFPHVAADGRRYHRTLESRPLAPRAAGLGRHQACSSMDARQSRSQSERPTIAR